MDTIRHDLVTRRQIAARLDLSPRQRLRLIKRAEPSLALAGYDSDGSAIYDRAQAEAFMRTVLASRAARGEYRSRALGECARPSRKDAEGRRICARATCREVVVGRRKLCDAHRSAGLHDQHL